MRAHFFAGLCCTLTACGGATAPAVRAPVAASASPVHRSIPTQTLARFDAIVHEYPDAAVPPTGFAVTDTGLVVVPVGGGVYAAGWGGWLIDPQALPLRAVAITGQSIYVTEAGDDATELSRWEARQRVQRFGSLPAGAYQLAATARGALWLAGRNAAGHWEIHHAAAGQAPQLIGSLPVPVLAISPVGEDAALVAVGKRILLLRRGAAPVLMAETREPVQGLAVEPDGSVLFTNSSGLYRLSKGAVQILATGISGPLQARRGRIFVLRRDKHHVLELRSLASGA